MRLLFIASLFSFSPMIWAQPLDTSKIEIKAMGRVRGETSNNADFSNSTDDKNNFVGSRFRVSLDFRPNEKTNIFTEFQHSKIWGVPSGILQDEPSSIHQAYLKHTLFAAVDLKIGRQELIYGDELIIGAVGWSNQGRSFDALKTRINYKFGWTDIFIADVTRNFGGTPTNDHYFSGLYNHFTFESIDELELYVLHTQDPAATINEVFHYGTRAKSQVGSFNYRAEVTLQSEVSALQWDLEAGYTFRNTEFELEFFNSSKDYIQLFPTAHKWLGIADFITRRNVGGGRIGIKQKFSDKVKALLSYHVFQRTDTDQPYYAFNGSAQTLAGTERQIGDELDLEIIYKIDPTFSVQLGGAHFFPGKHLKENNKNSAGDFYYLQTRADF